MRDVLRPRFLPAIIALVSLLLASKVIGLGFALLPVAIGLDASVISPAAAAPAAETEHTTTKSPVSQRPPLNAAANAGGVQSADQIPGSEPIGPPQPVVSAAERQLLQDLRARRQELDAREQRLTERENIMSAAEQRLNARVDQLTSLQTRLEQLEQLRKQHAEANWTGLVKVYEAMKPRDAAAIFNDMDMPILLSVVDRMKEAKVAPILAAMMPDRARLVTTGLAERRTRALDVPAERPTAG